MSRDCQECMYRHDYRRPLSPKPLLFPIPILSGPPHSPAHISAKWISWTALSGLVHCSNETALSAHHLSACQPAPRVSLSPSV